MSNEPLDAEYRVELPEFEGPLDLLLHLVRRHELDVFDIPVAFITEKYLSYLDLMRSLNIDVAGEYVLMASTLAFIKSRELLPRQPDEPDEEPEEQIASKDELIRRLLEYQRYKDAGAQLGERPLLGRQVHTRGAPDEKVDAKNVRMAEVGTFALLTALQEALDRSQVKLSYDVLIDRISITDRINELVDALSASQTIRFLDFLTHSGSSAQLKHELVVTFLAILEMARLKMVRILQETGSNEIYLTATTALSAVEATGGDQERVTQ